MSATPLHVTRYAIRDPLLRRLIKYIWIMTSNERVEVDSRMLPVANTDLVFSKGSPATYVADGSQPVTVGGCHFLGIHTHPHRVHQVGSLEVLGVSFLPAGAFPFFGTPMVEFSNRATSLKLMQIELADRLEQGLSESLSTNDKLRLVEMELMRALDRRLMPPEALHWIALRLAHPSESTTVESVCNDCGVHIRTAERWFRKYVGIGPKQFHRITRFQQAAGDLLHGNAKILTLVAHDRCFSDQSHFVREFASFAGASPSAFLAAADSMRASLTVKQ